MVAARLIEVGFDPSLSDGLGVIVGESIRAFDFCTEQRQCEELAEEMELDGTFHFATHIRSSAGGSIQWRIYRADCREGKIIAFDRV